MTAKKPKKPRRTVRQLEAEVNSLRLKLSAVNSLWSNTAAQVTDLKSAQWQDPAPSANDHAKGWAEAKMDGLCTVLETTKPDRWCAVQGRIAPIAAKIIRDWLRRRGSPGESE